MGCCSPGSQERPATIGVVRVDDHSGARGDEAVVGAEAGVGGAVRAGLFVRFEAAFDARRGEQEVLVVKVRGQFVRLRRSSRSQLRICWSVRQIARRGAAVRRVGVCVGQGPCELRVVVGEFPSAVAVLGQHRVGVLQAPAVMGQVFQIPVDARLIAGRVGRGARRATSRSCSWRSSSSPAPRGRSDGALELLAVRALPLPGRQIAERRRRAGGRSPLRPCRSKAGPSSASARIVAGEQVAARPLRRPASGDVPLPYPCPHLALSPHRLRLPCRAESSPVRARWPVNWTFGGSTQEAARCEQVVQHGRRRSR